MASTKILLYIDFASQPSRAVASFCDMAKIPFTLMPIRLAKGEGRTEEFKKINPLQKVPAMQEVDP